MKSVSDIFLRWKFAKKMIDFGINFKRRNMILYYKFCNAQSRFLNNSPTVLNGFCFLEIRHSLVLEAKINCETKLAIDMNSECIWSSFGHSKLRRFGPKIDSEESLGKTSFFDPFLSALEEGWLNLAPPPNPDLGGGMGETKGGSDSKTTLTRLQAPFHGVGGYM